VANLMFDLDAVSISTRERSGGGVWLGEVVATFGLVLVVFGAIRTARTETVAYAVGGYIAAAYWFTSSTSFANPAVTVARTLSDTFAGIEPASAPMFVLMQALGAGLAALLVRLLFPSAPLPATPSPAAARTKPAVLFVCVHNAGRSQMAAGYLEHLAGDRIDVLSAGSKPGAEINPVAVQAMAEEGIDIAGRRPEVLTAGAVQASDVVITMGCGDECPYFPGKRYEDWQLDDPAGQGIDAVRPIRDEIRRRVERLIDELLPA
jgi:arsenate reductase